MAQFVTFYSYKGGTGRSMALANVAWVLASNGKRVLVIDWDLEAPGLHRYFAPFLNDRELVGSESEGLIDYVFDFALKAATPPSDGETRTSDWFEKYSDISKWSRSLAWPSGTLLKSESSWGSIDFVPAGRQEPEYARKVNSFDWNGFYRQLGGEAFFEAMKRNAAKYDYVLIDSRTGVSDTAGICTVQIPDVVVVCFTLNHQSIAGAAAVASSIRDQRPGMRILPVPMRVDGVSEKLLSDSMKRYAQGIFLSFLGGDINPTAYWFEMELKYQPRYAFAETLATFEDQVSISNSLLPAMELLTRYITEGIVSKMRPLPEQHRIEALSRFGTTPISGKFGTGGDQGAIKRVFISYTHDSEEHRRRVLELAERLRSSWVDAWIDEYAEDGGVEWPEWTERQIRKANLVLVVCTALYRDAFEDNTAPGIKKGSTWEARFIRRHVYASDSVDTKFVPVLLEGGSPEDIPVDLQGSAYYSPGDRDGYMRLYRRITGQPAIVARPLGSPMDLPPETVPVPPLPDKAMAQQANAYLQRLSEETGEIRIGSIDRSSSQVSSFPISDVYVPIHIISETEAGEPQRASLETALRFRKAIIQGDAGSGKSTFMRCAAFDLCHESPGTTPLHLPERAFPLYIRVSELDAHITRIWGLGAQAPQGSPTRETDPAWLAHFLAMLEWGASQAFFESKLRHAKTVLLLDGLDEAPSETSRERMARLLGEVARRYPDCRIVVTTRPQALRGEVRPKGFEDVSIAPFDDEDVALFIERWCACKYAGEPAKAERERSKLAQALNDGEIAGIATNPLMLAALTVIHFNGGRLPDNRLDLYEAIVRWLAESRKHSLHADWQDRLENLRLLALGMQMAPGGRVRSLEVGEAVLLLCPPLARTDALRCLQLEEANGGILAARGQNVEFVHVTFQEYLAALELAAQDPEEIHKTIWEHRRLYSPEWREVMRFLTCILRMAGPKRVQRLFDAVIERTGATLAERARTVALLGTLLRDLREFRIANPRYETFVRQMAGLFGFPDAAPDLDARTRADAAEEWERLADVSALPLPSSPDYWVDLGKLRIGRYPVTVFEYAKFVKAGGEEPYEWEKQSLWPHRPVVRVNWRQAVNYCRWAGCRLATSEEWELAAAGREGREYPWGSEKPDDSDKPGPQRANFEDRVGRVTPVGLFPAGNIPEGVADLAGNVWEWTGTDYDADTKVVRGGAFGDSARALRAAFRVGGLPVIRDDLIGFRCVRDVEREFCLPQAGAGKVMGDPVLW